MKEHDHLRGDACRELRRDDASMTTIVPPVHSFPPNRDAQYRLCQTDIAVSLFLPDTEPVGSTRMIPDSCAHD